MASAQSRVSAGQRAVILPNAKAMIFCDALCGRDSLARFSELFISGIGLIGNMA